MADFETIGPELAQESVIHMAQSVAAELIPATGEGWGTRRKDMAIDAVKIIWEAEKIAKLHELEIKKYYLQNGQGERDAA